MIKETDFAKLKVGDILQHDSHFRVVTLFKTDVGVGVYHYYELGIKIYGMEHIMKEFTLERDKNILNMTNNTNINSAASTTLINEIIRLFINNPHIYHRAFSNYDMIEKDFAYMYSKDLIMEKLIRDRRTDKVYTILDVINISDTLYFEIERIGKVLGALMEYEKLYVSKIDLAEYYEFVKDEVNKLSDEPLYLYTDEEAKKMIAKVAEGVEVKNDNTSDDEPNIKFSTLCKEPTINISNLDMIRDVTNPDRKYVDLFRGDLVVGERYPIFSPKSDQYITIRKIDNHIIDYNRYCLDDDGKGIYIDSGEITDINLYKILSYTGSIEYNRRVDAKEPILTYYLTNSRLEMLDQRYCKNIVGIDFRCIEESNDENIYVYHRDSPEDKMKLYQLYRTSIDGNANLFIPYFIPKRLTMNDIINDDGKPKKSDGYKIGDCIVFDDNISMVVSKVNKSSYNLYINFYNRETIKSIRISKDLMKRFTERFKYYKSLSVPYLAKI